MAFVNRIAALALLALVAGCLCAEAAAGPASRIDESELDNLEWNGSRSLSFFLKKKLKAKAGPRGPTGPTGPGGPNLIDSGSLCITGYSINAYSSQSSSTGLASASCACVNDDYEPVDGYLIGGKCVSTGTTFGPLTTAGMVLDADDELSYDCAHSPTGGVQWVATAICCCADEVLD